MRACQFALYDEFEIGAVGVDQIWQALCIARLLFLAVIVRLELVFSLNESLASHQPTETPFRMIPKTRRANIDQSFRLVDYLYAVIDGGKRPFQRGAVTMLGRLPTVRQRANFREVAVDIHI